MNINERIHLSKQLYSEEFFATHRMSFSGDDQALYALPADNNCLLRKMKQFGGWLLNLNHRVMKKAFDHKVVALTRKINELQHDIGTEYETLTNDDMDVRFLSEAKIATISKQLGKFKKHYGKASRLTHNMEEFQKTVSFSTNPVDYMKLPNLMKVITGKMKLMKSILKYDPALTLNAYFLWSKATDFLYESTLKGRKLTSEEQLESLHLYADLKRSIEKLNKREFTGTKQGADETSYLVSELNKFQRLLMKRPPIDDTSLRPVLVRFANWKEHIVDRDCLKTACPLFREAFNDLGTIKEFDLKAFDEERFVKLIRYEATGDIHPVGFNGSNIDNFHPIYLNPSPCRPVDEYQFAVFIGNESYAGALLTYMIDKDIGACHELANEHVMLYEQAVSSLTYDQVRKLYKHMIKHYIPLSLKNFTDSFEEIVKKFKPIYNRFFTLAGESLAIHLLKDISKTDIVIKKEILTIMLVSAMNRFQLKFHQFDGKNKNQLWDVLREASDKTKGMLEYLAPFSLYFNEEQFAAVIREFPNISHFNHSVMVSGKNGTLDVSLRDAHLEELKKLRHLEKVTLSGEKSLTRTQLMEMKGSPGEWPMINTSLDLFTVN